VILLGYGLGLGVIASLMRHLWLGLLITVSCVLVYAFRSAYGKKLKSLFVLLGMPLVIIALCVWFGFSLFPDSDIARTGSQTLGVVSERIQSIGNSYDESFAWRAVVWQETLKAFSRTPLTGMGFGQYVPVEIGQYKAFVEVRDIHNSWLALLVQQGLVGAFLFGAFLISLLWPLFRTLRSKATSREPIIIVGALLLFQALVFLSQPYLETNLLGIWFWVTLGVAAALLRESQSRPSV
jgi:O-antigen ligase